MAGIGIQTYHGWYVWNTKISAFKELTAGTASPHVGFFVLFKSRLFLFLSCLYNNLSNFNRKLHMGKQELKEEDFKTKGTAFN